MKVAVLSRIWPGAIARLKAEHDCVVAVDPPPERKRAILAEAQVVVLRSPVVLDRRALEGAPALRLIVRAGTGLDSIDTDCARARGIEVVCVPLSARSVAEHSIALALSLLRRIPQMDRSLREGRWAKHAGLGRDLRGAHLGLLGFGRIGRRTAELGAAFGMPLSACDRSPAHSKKQALATRLGVRFLGLGELLDRSDVLCVQLPLTDATCGMLDAARLARLGPRSVLVNVGRGAVVDETALYDALATGRLAGAATDVFEEEPPGPSPLLDLENFVATPHVAAQTERAQRRIGRRVLDAIGRFEAEWAAGSRRQA